MAASSTFSVTNSYANSFTTGTGGTVTDSFTDSPSYSFAAGVAASQIDKPWSASASLTNAATTYTLSALAGPGAGTTAMVKVRKIWVHNLATADGNTLALAPGATQAWIAAFLDDIIIPAGGAVALIAPSLAGYPVVSGTTDKITVTATGTVPYKISIEGTSA